ncbi:hypothetical protein [Paracoccus aminovorans]|uniref:hypothetical protein n=1 Tax=Paracoccus aminovorans TaxID=34004 RepID=UPI0012E33B18|nr:hypothetical protein [Paracoccus aminovorans]
MRDDLWLIACADAGPLLDVWEALLRVFKKSLKMQKALMKENDSMLLALASKGKCLARSI